LEGRTPDITGVEVVDSNTLRIHLEKPNAVFLHMLTNPIFWVYDTAETSDPAPGTGPFVLQPSDQDHTLILVRNDNYHRGQSKVSALQVTLYKEPYQAFGDFKAGKLDYLNQVPLAEIKNIESNPDLKDQFVDRYLWETYSLAFNMHREPFAGNYLLRRALNYAVDRKAIIETVLGDAYRTSKGALPMGMPGYNKQLRGYAYDPEKAKDLLAEAGYPGGEGLKPLILAFNKDEGHRAVAEAVAQQFNQLGIDVQLQEMEWDYYKKQVSSMALTLFRVGWHGYPLCFVGTGATLNEATDNGLMRASRFLGIPYAEVLNRATITGAIGIGRLPGVATVTFLVPMELLDKKGLLDLVQDKYGG